MVVTVISVDANLFDFMLNSLYRKRYIELHLLQVQGTCQQLNNPGKLLKYGYLR